MFNTKYKFLLFAVAVVLMLLSVAIPNSTVMTTEAADHLEAPGVAGDTQADIADVYAFLDPNDNSKVVLALDVEGFVVPAELLNQCCFSSEVVYRFEIENTGDNKADKFIDVTFEQQNNRRSPQVAHIKLPDGSTFDALSTVQVQRGDPRTVSTANALRVTTDPKSGVSFFAGLTDDPFFFDVIGFNRYVIKLVDRNPSAKDDLTRGRDSFGGFNIHMITLSVPAAMLRGSAGNVVGINGVTLRPRMIEVQPGGKRVGMSKDLVQIDRMAVPVINTVLVTTLQRKDQYNATSAENTSKFFPDILFAFRFIRTSDEAATAAAGLLAKGDYLRLDLTKPNNTLGEGEAITDGPNFAGFPNGRRPGDDVIDTILFFVNSLNTLTDSVDRNDRQFSKEFPFFAQPNQPPIKGADDNTAF